VQHRAEVTRRAIALEELRTADRADWLERARAATKKAEEEPDRAKRRAALARVVIEFVGESWVYPG